MQKKRCNNLITFKKEFYQFVTDIPKYLKGKPVVLIVWTYVVKVILNPSAKYKLKNEVHNSHEANKSKMYSDVVVTQYLPLPYVALSKYYLDNGSKSDKISAMIDFIIRRFDALDFDSITSSILLKTHLKSLTSHKNSDFINRLSKTVCRKFFEYEVPVSFMHGDFGPGNAILSNNELYLVDWEHASKTGSFLYDWWFFERCILTEENEIKKSDYTRFYRFIKKSLTNMNIDMDQYQIFGYAMNTIIELSRLESRKFDPRKMHLNLEKIHLAISNYSP